MSKSRLEKFLYALYSLDSSDLPTPLSRIEELYNCLVTGEEAPTFKPLSRVEKYLMAILGVYDVDSLPNPLSRVEVLLYKLATGDDNLDDVETFLSEHEELLAEIIRNWGVGGNIEYVLYTLSAEHSILYNTAKKPIKSAILKGNTMINLFKETSRDTQVDINYLFFKIIGNQLITLKPNTQYTLMFDKYIEGINTIVFKTHNDPLTIEGYQYGQKFTFTTLDDVGNAFYVFIKGNTVEIAQQMLDLQPKIIIIEGDHSSVDSPYFEGMQSVKMPVLTTVGKNLLNLSSLSNSCSIRDGGYYIDVTLIKGGSNYNLFSETFGLNTVQKDISNFIKLKPNTTYTLSRAGEASATVSGSVFDLDGNRIVGTSALTSNVSSRTFTTTENAIYFAPILSSAYSNETTTIIGLQLEEGSTRTTYEPYKSNILTVNEEVELRAIGDVKDELNLLTGEVTRRIGEVVFNGTEDWVQSSGLGDPTIFYTSLNDLAHKQNYKNSISCDKFVTYISHGSLVDPTLLNGITGYFDNTYTYPNENWLYVKYEYSEGSVEKLKQWLSQNPITVQYELATESVKTVDLSLVDQDGNNTKLKTFNDITYVTLSSEGLIPEAELEVATKNKEVLNTMSLEMNDISTTQNALQETSDIQSENVDATMIATTEIYEGLL